MVLGLGLIRFGLGMMVLLNHLWLPTANVIGAHAVTGFYIVSGFLMTKVINEVYLGELGRLRYVANRLLRIYPAYLLVVFATLLGLIIWPGYFNVYSLIRIPVDAEEWFSNVTLYRLTDSPTILIPPGWSLFVEMFFYIVIAILGRWRSVVFRWFVISFVYTVWMVVNGLPFRDRYYPLAAASLFFSAGAGVYVICQSTWMIRLFAWLPRVATWAAAALFVVFPIVVEALGGDRGMLGYYGASAVFLVIFISLVTRNRLDGGRWDRFLGDLAYPVFLTHFFSAGVVNLLTSNRFMVTSTINMVLSTAMCLAISVAFLKWVEPQIEKMRNRIRGRAAWAK